jgi:MFS superfamily sulfate permease-like transporter
MHNGSTSTTADVGPTSAIVSLISLIISFFDSPHVWLQNCTLLVSLVAGLIAIYVGIKKLIK